MKIYINKDISFYIIDMFRLEHCDVIDAYHVICNIEEYNKLDWMLYFKSDNPNSHQFLMKKIIYIKNYIEDNLSHLLDTRKLCYENRIFGLRVGYMIKKEVCDNLEIKETDMKLSVFN